MKTKKSKPPVVPEYPKVIETFGKPYLGTIGTDRGPSCFNSVVSIRRYRITVEEIPEPDEVLRDRLRKLWRECDNHHHWSPLQAAANELNITLAHADFGKDIPARSR